MSQYHEDDSSLGFHRVATRFRVWNGWRAISTGQCHDHRRPALLFARILVGERRCQDGGPHQAEVGIVGGLPCFSIGSSSEPASAMPILSSVRVDERANGVARNIWEADFLDQGDFVLSPGDCVPYAKGEPDPTPELVPGRAYSVTILADVKVGGRFTARWYSAHFCMLETGQGLLSHQIEAGGRSDASGWAACGTGVRW